MNYLAHAYLSFNYSEIIVGNMISDFVKGKKKFDYSDKIQAGIMLHRDIDNFTDTHFATQKAKQFFKPVYRLYSGAFVDIIYDHFLATDKNEFLDNYALNSLAQQTYEVLENYFSVLPERFQKLFFYMKTQNWLYNYQYIEIIEKSFRGLVYRAAYLNESEIAFNIFKKNYKELKEIYEDFFSELKFFTAQRLRNHFSTESNL